MEVSSRRVQLRKRRKRLSRYQRCASQQLDSTGHLEHSGEVTDSLPAVVIVCNRFKGIRYQKFILQRLETYVDRY